MKKPYNAAIVLAAGRGKRMKSDVQKQYLLIDGKPVLYYSLEAFQNSSYIEEIILVVGEGEEDYCQKEIVEKYGFHKVSKIVKGGAERYHSVQNGLKAIAFCDHVFIHDGARPFVNEEIIGRAADSVQQYKACAVGMPAKDTIKIADEEGFASFTPERRLVWSIQTPQVFAYELICRAHELREAKRDANITDDAMMIEAYTDVKVKLVEGSYENIKITTPEDLDIAERFLRR